MYLSFFYLLSVKDLIYNICYVVNPDKHVTYEIVQQYFIDILYLYFFYLFRVKDLISNGYANYVVNPDKHVTYEIVQQYVNNTAAKITSPLLANWKDSLGDIPQRFSFTHMYEFLMKRSVLVLGKDAQILETLDLPVAEKPLVKGYNFYGSGHVTEIKVNVTDGYCHVWSKVYASMKDQLYLSKIVLEGASGLVISAECACVAGRGGKCNHVAAVLFALLKFREVQSQPSCTGQPQKWHLPSRKRKRETVPKKIGELHKLG